MGPEPGHVRMLCQRVRLFRAGFKPCGLLQSRTHTRLRLVASKSGLELNGGQGARASAMTAGLVHACTHPGHAMQRLLRPMHAMHFI
jgi:hypothetical protein